MANILTRAWRSIMPGRGETVTAAAAPAGGSGGYDGDSIVIPMARDRALEIFERVQRPQDVASTIDNALTGELWHQQMLFQAMIDTWPRLQKALREVKLKARKAPWQAVPWAARGDKPDKAAETRAKEIEGMIWGMRPDPVRGLKGFEGMVEELASAYFLGHHVLEIHWKRGKGGLMSPASVMPVPPRYYGYPIHEDGGPDRLMLDRSGGVHGSTSLEDFPPHRFLVAVNGGHPGHPAQAAPLRALANYWLAAVFGLKWFAQYSQLFGIPFRWATYTDGDTKAKSELTAMMQNIGAQGWGAFKKGVELNFLESAKSGTALPQKALLDLADEQCDVFILGQTLTSSQGDRGSQALGTVHMDVRDELLAGICDFVGEVLTHQLVPAIAAVNGGEVEDGELPGIWAKFEQPKDEKGMAERDKALGLLDGSMPVAREWLYERHAVPMPADGDELFKEEAEEPEGTGDGGQEAGKKPGKPPGKDEKPEKVEARYNPLQPRDPGGEGGGQWVKDGAAGKGKGATRGEMRAATAEERKKFGIAPAFTDAMITDDPSADLRATAKNAKGKTVYYYSDEYSRSQAAAKFARIGALHKAMPGLQARIDEDIMAGGADAEQALALRLITLTGLRNGGEDGGGKVESFGASSLRTDHARVEGDTVHLDFSGKKGVRQRHSFTDSTLARHIAGKQKAGAAQLFDGDAGKTLAYLKKISGDKFKVHDFRTWHGTMLAHATVRKLEERGEVPKNAKEFKAFQKRVSKVVGRALGNDPAMSLKAYIHPAVFDSHRPAESDRKKAA